MTDPIQYDLLGYLLDALEPEERQEIEARLSRDPALQDQLALLRRGLDLLDDEPHCEPPAGLAARTCRLIASQGEVTIHRETIAGGRPTSGPPRAPHESLSPPPRRWRFIDLAVALAICVAGMALFIPLIQASRVQARVTACADKLHDLGVALTSYSVQHNGLFPQVAESGNLAAGGIYAPLLLDSGFIVNPQTVVCPGSQLADDPKFRVPTLDELETAKGKELAELQRRMGGTYGYALGYRENGVYKPTRNLYRKSFALAADIPADDLSASPNHGRTGQNVLLEDGHVVFLRSSRVDGSDDDIFRNDAGLVAAGCHVNDSVVVRSNIAP